MQMTLRMLVGVLLALPGLSCTRSTVRDEYGLTKDHYEVIQKALAHAYDRGALGRDLTVVFPASTRLTSEHAVRASHKVAFRDLLSIKNVAPYVHGLLCVGTNAIGADSLAVALSGMKKEIARRFYYVRVSPVGFDSDRNTAVVFCGWTCGNMCGYSKLLLYSKKAGKWEFAGEVLLSVS
jgi:hypothetical protein